MLSMKVDTQISVPQYTAQSKSAPVVHSKAGVHTTSFTQENKIQKLDQINIVNNYFKIFDQNLSETAIKNLISARLQPGYQLPQVHNTQALALKAEELLDFSLAI